MKGKYDNIPGIEGRYISRRGHLYTRFDKSGNITPRIDKKGDYIPLKWRKCKVNSNQRGYLFRQIKVNGKSKAYYIHRLVAMAYLPNPKQGQKEVDHIDNDVTNNKVSNLRWVSPKENVRHTYESGNRHSLKMTTEKILEMESMYRSGVRICELTKIFQVGRTTVRKILNHKRVFQNYK